MNEDNNDYPLREPLLQQQQQDEEERLVLWQQQQEQQSPVVTFYSCTDDENRPDVWQRRREESSSSSSSSPYLHHHHHHLHHHAVPWYRNSLQIMAMLSNYSTSYNVVNISLVLPILEQLLLLENNNTTTAADVTAAAASSITEHHSTSTTTSVNASAVASSLLAGMILGQVVGGALGDASCLGLARALFLVMMVQIIASLGSAIFVPSPWQSSSSSVSADDLYWSLAAFRFVLGIAAGAVYPLAACLSVEQGANTNSGGGIGPTTGTGSPSSSPRADAENRAAGRATTRRQQQQQQAVQQQQQQQASLPPLRQVEVPHPLCSETMNNHDHDGNADDEDNNGDIDAAAVSPLEDDNDDLHFPPEDEQAITRNNQHHHEQQLLQQSRRVVWTFCTQGLGFWTVPAIATLLLYTMPVSKLDLVWRIILGLGSVPGIVLVYLQLRLYRHQTRIRLHSSSDLHNDDVNNDNNNDDGQHEHDENLNRQRRHRDASSRSPSDDGHDATFSTLRNLRRRLRLMARGTRARPPRRQEQQQNHHCNHNHQGAASPVIDHHHHNDDDDINDVLQQQDREAGGNTQEQEEHAVGGESDMNHEDGNNNNRGENNDDDDDDDYDLGTLLDSNPDSSSVGIFRASENVTMIRLGWWASLTSEPNLVRKLLGTAGTWFLFDVLFYGNTLFQPIVTEAAFGPRKENGEHPAENNPLHLLQRTATDSLILTSVALPGYFVAALVMGRSCCSCHVWGIKTIVQTPRFVMLQGFAVMAVLYGTLGLQWKTLQQHDPIILLLLYSLTFFFANYGPNTTTFILPSLVFSPECRSTLNGLAAAGGKAGALAGATFFAPAAETWGDATVMLICSAVAVVAFGMTQLFVQIPNSNNQHTSTTRTAAVAAATRDTSTANDGQEQQIMSLPNSFNPQPEQETQIVGDDGIVV